jgi:hypothetical protein
MSVSDNLHIMRDSHIIGGISLKLSDSLNIMHDSHIICLTSANLSNILFSTRDSHTLPVSLQWTRVIACILYMTHIFCHSTKPLW